jgi:hypothetical protein
MLSLLKGDCMKKFIAISLLLGFTLTSNVYASNIERDSLIVRISSGDVLKKVGNQWIPVIIGSDLSKNDIIKTGENSTVLIELPENSGFIRLLPETEVKISNIKIDKTFEGAQITELSLNKGKVVTKVRKFNRKSSKLEINTRGATAAVRGTAFITSFDEKTDKTKVTVGDGKVSVKAGKKEIFVNPKEYTEIKTGESANMVSNVSNDIIFRISSIKPNNNKLNIKGVTEVDAESVNLGKISVYPNSDGSFSGDLQLKDGEHNLELSSNTIDGREKISKLRLLKFTE